MKLSRKRIGTPLVGLLLASALGLVGCAANTEPSSTDVSVDSGSAGGLGTEAEEASMMKLYEEAREAGQNQVVVYGTSDHESYIAAFQKRFPDITVTTQPLQGADRDTRIDAEVASGNFVADIAKDGSSPMIRYVEDGRCQVWEPVVDVPSEWLRMDSKLATSSVAMFGITYNTTMIDESEVPSSWQDLLEPEWADKSFSMTSPSAGGVTAYTFAIMLTPEENANEFGWEYIDAFKAQNPNLVAKDALAVQAVANGETAISAIVFQPYFESVKAQGAPIEFKIFEENNMYSEAAFCLLNDSPNKLAAELFMNWRFTPEGQNASAMTGSYPVMPGAEAPSGMPAFEDVSLLPMLPEAERAAAYGPLIKEITDTFMN